MQKKTNPTSNNPEEKKTQHSNGKEPRKEFRNLASGYSTRSGKQYQYVLIAFDFVYGIEQIYLRGHVDVAIYKLFDDPALVLIIALGGLADHWQKTLNPAAELLMPKINH